jgi:DNA topoisomerase-6 subunit B
MKIMNLHGSSNDGFTSISPSEFFYRNRQMAGFANPTQAVYSTVRELVENSLDACENAYQLPKINVEVNRESSEIVTIKVADNGTGLPYEQVPKAFGTVLYGNKYDQRQERGTFGLGVTMAVLYGQITTNTPTVIHTQQGTAPGRLYQILIDIQRNTPIIISEDSKKRKYPGTSVTIRLKGNFARAHDRVLEYLKLTTISTPYAMIILQVNDEYKEKIGRWIDTIPKPPAVSKPHPHMADLEFLNRLVQVNHHKKLKEFLIDTFQQLGIQTASRFLKFISMNPRQPVGSLNTNELAHLSQALTRYDGFKSPDGTCLNPIGKIAFIQSVQSMFNATNPNYFHRGPCEWEGNPFIIEGVIAHAEGTPASEPVLFRFANRVPLLYDANEDVLTKVMKQVDWSRYNINNEYSSLLFIHICSTKIPYKAAGKQSIDSIPEIEKEAAAVFRALGRKYSKSTKQRAHALRDIRRMRQFAKNFKLIAKYGSILAESESIPSTSHLVETLFEVTSND